MTDHADLIERLRGLYEPGHGHLYHWAQEAADAIESLSETARIHARNVIAAEMEIDALKARVKRLEDALHEISLCGQNSMSTKHECGRIARDALAGDKCMICGSLAGHNGLPCPSTKVTMGDKP